MPEQGVYIASPLKELSLSDGPIADPQLRLLTSGAHKTLQNVSFKGIRGLTNCGLRSWLVDVGPSLTHFDLERTSIRRQSKSEEYALDATISQMSKLRQLTIDGDVASELVILRRVPLPYSRLTCEHVPGINARGVVDALRYTGWGTVSVSGSLFHGNEPMKSEGEKMAKTRGISFQVRGFS